MTEEFPTLVQRIVDERIVNKLKIYDPAALLVSGFPQVKAQCVDLSGVVFSDAYVFISSIFCYDEPLGKLVQQNGTRIESEIAAIYSNIHFVFSEADKAAEIASNQQYENDLNELFVQYNALYPPTTRRYFTAISFKPTDTPKQKLVIVQAKILSWSNNTNPTDLTIMKATTNELYNMFPGANNSLKRNLVFQYWKCVQRNPYETLKVNRQSYLSQIQSECHPGTKLSNDTLGLQYYINTQIVISQVANLSLGSAFLTIPFSFTKLPDSNRTRFLHYSTSDGGQIHVPYSSLMSNAAALEIDFTQITVEVFFKGFAHYPTLPVPFQAAIPPDRPSSGWLDFSVIAEAIRNRNSNESGYRFVSDNYGPNKFRRLGEFGLCGGLYLYATTDISVSYVSNDLNQLRTQLRTLQGSDSQLTFFEKYQTRTMTIDQERLKIEYHGPPFNLVTNPHAYVMGILPIWPGDQSMERR